MGQYLGLVAVGSTGVKGSAVVRNSTDVPINADSLPTYRVYGPLGTIMNNGTGSLALQDTKAITGTTNATPIVITSSAHGLSTGTRVTITGVVGNTAANATWTITKIDANTFSLDTSVGNGAYVSGGTWNVSGLYSYSIDVIGGDGYAAGSNYSVLWTAFVSAVAQSDLDTFTVV